MQIKNAFCEQNRVFFAILITFSYKLLRILFAFFVFWKFVSCTFHFFFVPLQLVKIETGCSGGSRPLR